MTALLPPTKRSTSGPPPPPSSQARAGIRRNGVRQDPVFCCRWQLYWLAPGGCAGRIAWSHRRSDGILGKLNAADELCAIRAKAANLPGGWTAWLSDDTTDAIDRIPDGEYRLLDGTVIANNKAELLDGTLDNAIDVDENGDTVSGELGVWTGTNADGTNSGVNCSNWDSDSSTGQSGLADADATDATWTDNQTEDCDLSKRLYCFGWEL